MIYRLRAVEYKVRRQGGRAQNVHRSRFSSTANRAGSSVADTLDRTRLRDKLLAFSYVFYRLLAARFRADARSGALAFLLLARYGSNKIEYDERSA